MESQCLYSFCARLLSILVLWFIHFVACSNSYHSPCTIMFHCVTEGCILVSSCCCIKLPKYSDLNNTHLDLKSKISLTGLELRCPQGWFLLEAPRTMFPSFPASSRGCLHSFVCGPFSIFKANKQHCICNSASITLLLSLTLLTPSYQDPCD